MKSRVRRESSGNNPEIEGWAALDEARQRPKKHFKIIINVYVPGWICHMCVYPWGPEEGVLSPKAGANKWLWATWHGFWELNLGLWKSRKSSSPLNHLLAHKTFFQVYYFPGYYDPMHHK